MEYVKLQMCPDTVIDHLHECFSNVMNCASEIEFVSNLEKNWLNDDFISAPDGSGLLRSANAPNVTVNARAEAKKNEWIRTVHLIINGRENYPVTCAQ